MCVVGKSDMYSVTTNAVHTYRRYPIGLATPTSRPALAMSDKSALSPLHPARLHRAILLVPICLDNYS